MNLFSSLRGLVSRALGKPALHAGAGSHQSDAGSTESPHTGVIECVVDNRVFLLGLCELYRDAMKWHERGELLACAQRVAAVLGVEPADVPIEGYYSEAPPLTLYFRLMRTLQSVSLERASEVERLRDFRRLLEVASSPIFGTPKREQLLPVGRDPLSTALAEVEDLADWSVPLLTKIAGRIAQESDNCSLVGLAARAGDFVAMAALRESVVLYAQVIEGAPQRAAGRPYVMNYLWRVDPTLAAAGQRFVDAFNQLSRSSSAEGRKPILLDAKATSAETFWFAGQRARVDDRCARLGQSRDEPPLYYHWAICRAPDDELAVVEFWDQEIWTTERFRSSQGHHGKVFVPSVQVKR